MLDGLEGWHILIIVALAALLFGSGKLPGAARSVGQSLRIFKSELRAGAEDDAPPVAPTAQDAVAPQAVAAPAPYTPEPYTPAPTPEPAPVAAAEPQPVVVHHTGV